MKTYPKDLAFPATMIHPSGEFEPQCYSGLTKREFFAALAMQGIKASTPGCAGEDVGIFAVKAADDLIIELNKEKTVKP